MWLHSSALEKPGCIQWLQWPSAPTYHDVMHNNNIISYTVFEYTLMFAIKTLTNLHYSQNSWKWLFTTILWYMLLHWIQCQPCISTAKWPDMANFAHILNSVNRAFTLILAHCIYIQVCVRACVRACVRVWVCVCVCVKIKTGATWARFSG